MIVKVLQECGFDHAMLGLSLSYRAPVENMLPVAQRLAHRGGGENKFLESMIMWLDVQAPRYFWQEADTYRLSTKQSESTVHMIMKRELTVQDFQDGLDAMVLEKINEFIRAKDFRAVKRHLPESFLQRRVWCMSYKTLQNIWYQRCNHRLPEWHLFLGGVLIQIKHPEFISKDLIERRPHENPIRTDGDAGSTQS